MMSATKRSPAAGLLLVAALSIAACGSSASTGGANAAANQSGPKAATNLGSRAAGRIVEQPLQAVWNGFEIQDQTLMTGQLVSSIRGKPTLTQVGAIEASLAYMKGDALQQRLVLSAPKFIRDIERDFPATKSLLDKEAASINATVIRRAATTSTSSPTTATSNLQAVAGPIVLGNVATCLTKAGGAVNGTKALGGGRALYATLPGGTYVSIGKASSARLATATETALTSHGFSVSALKNDPQAFVVVKGTPDPSDMALVSKCTA